MSNCQIRCQLMVYWRDGESDAFAEGATAAEGAADRVAQTIRVRRSCRTETVQMPSHSPFPPLPSFLPPPQLIVYGKEELAGVGLGE